MTDALSFNTLASEHNHETVVVAESAAMRRVLSLAQRFAPTEIPVLLLGATGTGKELLAQFIHEASGRRGHFVDINCGNFPSEMMDSLLFGHRKGAFTGAIADTQGLISAADQGTLFLDELSSLPLEGQVKLLRVLDNRAIRRVGDTESRSVAFRLIAAVQEDLNQDIHAGAFRLDLFQRAAGVVLEIPPLRERAEDLMPLARHFAGKAGRTIPISLSELLRQYDWPGNVRELRSAVERAVFLTDDKELSAAAVAEAIHLGAPGLVGRTDGASERGRIEAAGQAHEWNAQLMARALGVGRATLFRRLKRLGLSLRRE